ncbi:hypothetical protein Ctha_1367 [Chloroherpeton thalassium ATCC 35110]|uniref:Uncharacterized protein n=1 Tax=Chloroherpeton thalassium (strain ATCC 35110 / GB-78) TaxID=517418 RepID=B3QZD7_CHLT3|nr:hypothetical protein [Chloroherpeton thalassium]ACF13830.1 hypothetical protein Ctha_1367 [Chloroherpeton thalassium ATCC 35110]
MNELIEKPEDILTHGQELMKHPVVKNAVLKIVNWIGTKVFAGKKATQEKLALLEAQKADAALVADLKAKLEFVLEDNDALRKELAAQVNALNAQLKQAGAQTQKTNTASVSGEKNNLIQDSPNSSIHIGRQINQGDGSTYNENK